MLHSYISSLIFRNIVANLKIWKANFSGRNFTVFSITTFRLMRTIWRVLELLRNLLLMVWEHRFETYHHNYGPSWRDDSPSLPCPRSGYKIEHLMVAQIDEAVTLSVSSKNNRVSALTVAEDDASSPSML